MGQASNGNAVANTQMRKLSRQAQSNRPEVERAGFIVPRLALQQRCWVDPASALAKVVCEPSAATQRYRTEGLDCAQASVEIVGDGVQQRVGRVQRRRLICHVPT